MTKLRFPLKDHLQDPVDDAVLQRMAQEIDVRILARSHGRRSRLPLLAVAAVAVAIAVFALVRRDRGPLSFSDGRPLATVEAGSEAKEIVLSDGSHVRLSPGARFEPLASSGVAFSAVLTRGRADIEVRPDGRRHWTIECGLATVEVVGTRFSCDLSAGRLRVLVKHGAVLVRGERVPNRVRHLVAGEAIELTEDAPASQSRAPASRGPAIPPASAPESPAPTEMHDVATAPTRITAARNWRELARHGRHAEAFTALGSEGLRRESKKLGVGDLLALADVARLSGHPAEAVAPLERILTDFASDADAPLAAFALGRLCLDSLGRPQAAVAALDKALALGVPRSLREDVRGRLVEAHARAGNAAGARRAATAYFDEFPQGRHARAIEGWLGSR
jgi:transmembrane sensor